MDRTIRASHIGRPNIPRRAFALLNGDGVEHFHSRSEAEQSIIVSLINSGKGFDSVKNLFSNYPAAGKFAGLYAENRQSAISWLRRSYDKGLEWAKTHESEGRKMAKRAMSWAQSIPWQGRTGATDRAVFISHCQIAFRAGRITYSASARELAEKAGVTHPTASRATNRLIGKGILSREKRSTVDCAAIYRLNTEGANFTTSSLPTCEEVVNIASHDTWRIRGLGKTGAEIWKALKDKGPMTKIGLRDYTGRHITTINRKLNLMAKLVDSSTGEVLSLVAVEGDKWHAINGDLDLIAQIIGTAGLGKRQREKHRAERRAHRRSLLIGQLKNQ